MAKNEHVNPDGSEKFVITVELSRYNIGLAQYFKASVKIEHFSFVTVTFNFWDPSTWGASGRFVRSEPGYLEDSSSQFLDVNGEFIPGLVISNSSGRGYSSLYTVYYYVGAPPPDDIDVLGRVIPDARSVRKVNCLYRLPWDNTQFTLKEDSWI